MDTWRSADDTYTVILEPAGYREMLRLARSAYPKEAGSALAGSYSDDGWEARITQLGPQSPDSKGSRMSFARGIAGLADFMARLFHGSGGRVHYVGEWHSHPDGAPVPSPTDHRNMMAIATDEKSRCPECILVIIGAGKSQGEMSLHVYSNTRGHVQLFKRDNGGA